MAAVVVARVSAQSSNPAPKPSIRVARVTATPAGGVRPPRVVVARVSVASRGLPRVAVFRVSVLSHTVVDSTGNRFVWDESGRSWVPVTTWVSDGGALV